MAKKADKLQYESGVVPKSISAISQDYITAYYTDKVTNGLIDQKKLADWIKFVEKVSANEDLSDMKKFATIRKEFVKLNFPSLIKKEKGETFLDALKKLQTK